MDTPSAESDVLRRHFSGKRSAPRVPCATPVALVGSTDVIRGRAIDLSEGGSLVEIVEDEFVAASSEGPTACALLAQRHFASGLRWVLLDDSGKPLIGVEADLVRITVGVDRAEGVRAGIRFRRPLTAAEREVMGLSPVETNADRWVPRRGAPPYLLLFPTRGASAGPLCAARVLWLSGRSVGARVEGTADPEGLARLLNGGTTFHATLLLEGHRLWETGGRAAQAKAADRGVELEWNAETGIEPAALKRFRRA